MVIGMFKEFKEFALKGNVVDMAVGVIIGGAFGKIVSSVVSDLIMPLVGLITGKMNFANMFVLLGEVPPDKTVVTIEQAKELNIPTFNYGQFLTSVIDFFIMAFVIFLFVKLINRLKKIGKKEVAAPKTTKKCVYCRTVIDIEATRCPHCTSELPKEEGEEESQAEATV